MAAARISSRARAGRRSYCAPTRAAGSGERLQKSSEAIPSVISGKAEATGMPGFSRTNLPNSQAGDLMLVQVKKPEDSKYPWDYYQILARIPGERAFGPPNPACPLVNG